MVITDLSNIKQKYSIVYTDPPGNKEKVVLRKVDLILRE